MAKDKVRVGPRRDSPVDIEAILDLVGVKDERDCRRRSDGIGKPDFRG